MKRLAVLLTVVAFMMVAPFAHAGQFAMDPCQGAGRVTVPINITSATTTSMVAPITGSYIFVCGLSVNSVGGSTTFEYGTGSTCGTGTTALTGPLAAAGTITTFPTNSLIQTPVSQRLCILSGASTSGTNGWFTYVQTPIQGY